MKNNPRSIQLFYIYSLLEHLTLWYVIEKVYVRSVGISDQAIVLNAGVRAVVSLLLEIPTGSIGDIWGYRKTLRCSLLLMCWGGVELIAFTGVGNFFFATMLWTTGFTLASGTKQAFLFNLTQKTDSQDQYLKFASTSRALGSFGVVIGSLLGSFSTSFTPLWFPFLISVLPSALGFFILGRIPETNTEKHLATTSITKHSYKSFLHVIKNHEARLLIYAAIPVALPFLTYLELSQLHYLAVGLPIIYFGLMDTTRFIANMLGGLCAHRLGSSFSGKAGVLLTFIIVTLSLAGLFFWRNNYSLFFISILTFVALCFETNIDNKLQKILPNDMRAAATSTLSFINNLLWFFLMLIISLFSRSNQIFSIVASLLGISLLALMIFLLKFFRNSPSRRS